MDPQLLPLQARLALSRWEAEGGAGPAAAVLAARALERDAPACLKAAGATAGGRADGRMTAGSSAVVPPGGAPVRGDAAACASAPTEPVPSAIM